MRKDPWLWGALGVGLLLRLLPMFLWPYDVAVRDEIVYRYLAGGIFRDGVMGVTTKGWVAAPGYPYSLALCRWAFGSIFEIKWFQIAISVSSIGVLYAITRRLGSSRSARLAAWMMALHPTLAWYSGNLWTETIYIGFLLPAVLAVLVAREARGKALWFAIAAGGCLAVCVLFRGIATPLAFLFALALVWPVGWTRAAWSESLRAQGRSAAALLLTVTLLVAPYSLYASRLYGGVVISDATVGHVMFLGNNTYPPMTFDYGNGVLTQPLYYRYIRSGRAPCAKDRGRTPAEVSRCEIDNAVDWIADNPTTFVSRIPLRLAQEFNPHSFLTRHIRWGGLDPLPWAFKELLVAWIALSSTLVVWGGSLGGIARGRGPYAVMAGGTIGLTLLAAAGMYGMTRFRLPLEPLWMVWLALLLSDPRGTLAGLRIPLRGGLALLVLPSLAGLTSWFAATGFPMFWR